MTRDEIIAALADSFGYCEAWVRDAARPGGHLVATGDNEDATPMIIEAGADGDPSIRVATYGEIADALLAAGIGWRTSPARRAPMAASPWIVQHSGGWCALPSGAVPDPEAWNDPTLCGHVVTMRGGSQRGRPDCPDCLARLGKDGTDGN